MLKIITRRGITLPRNLRCRTTSSSTVTLPNVDEFQVKNEPILNYLKGSKERSELESQLKAFLADPNIEIPIVIGGEEIKCGEARSQVLPFNHGHRLAKFHWATSDVVARAIDASQKARPAWEAVSPNERIKLFQKAADLISTKYRMKLNAATMLGQAKTVVQAEIDSAAELADFLRFNAYFAKETYKYQPISENPNVELNQMRHRGIEGFVAAISPFNFTAIGGNLASAPALMVEQILASLALQG